MSIKALIPVRSGSLRVKNKNIRPFANSTLLEIKIRQMKRIQAMGLIDGVVVNSNCDEMLDMALGTDHFLHPVPLHCLGGRFRRVYIGGR